VNGTVDPGPAASIGGPSGERMLRPATRFAPAEADSTLGRKHGVL